MNTNKVCAVVVTYNKIDLLKECISRLEKQTFLLNHLIVVDNASTDGTGDYLDQISKSNSSVIPIYLLNNIGGAGGFNAGIKSS
ncbi:glycosyltransferase [Paucilactobacillus hokkaidonensis]|uniref:glycosyltransferase n=1 Tax=Paucilactobacillus hokkaidonensis TaxID=1193095 RepID=UPI000AD99F60|nr:glycosyltransferase [Paucilactobacillus hokkaidonensis]